MIWAFGSFELDEQNFALTSAGRPVELRRKVFDVLHYLVRHHDRMVTKEELLQQVWPGETIQEAVIAQNIAILRKTLGDSRGEAKVIQTVHGRGYRFVADVVALPRPSSATRSSAPPPPAPPNTPLVGRGAVLGELRGLLERARAGRGGFALVTGEAGIGKTRIAEQLASDAAALGARVLEGRCHEGEGAPAYWPWVQVLRAAAGESDREQLLEQLGAAGSEVAHLVRELRGRFGEPERAAPLSSAEARFRLFDGITSFLSRLARAQPLLLVFDDLHWADEATLHLLRFLAREVRGLPLLVLATARDADPRAPSAALLPALIGDAHVQRIYLTGLTREATSELVAATLERPLEPGTLNELYALSEGNPFFLHELLRLLADDANARGGLELARAELPLRVREVICLRLRGLLPETQRLLVLASVIGRDFPLAVLEQVAGVSREELLAQLEPAVTARILREPEPRRERDGAAGQYRFAHALIRESLYAALSGPERARRHDQVGRALEALYGVDADAHASELAHHFYRAATFGDVERAVAYCVRAAEQALELLAFEQAVSHYRRALEALQCRLPIDEQQRFALKLGLGSALFRAGEDGNPALLGAADIARRLGRPDLLGRVVLAMAGWPRLFKHGRTGNRELYPLLEEALAAPLDDQPGLRARLLGLLALNAPHGTPDTIRAEHSRKALALARGLGDDEALYDALLSRLRLLNAPEEMAEREAAARELLEVATRLGHKERMFTAHELRVQPLLALGDLRAADQEIAVCGELADALRLPNCSLQVLRFKLERALGDGRLHEIRSLTEQAVRVRGKAQTSPGYMVMLYAWRTFERALRGDEDWFERHIGGMAGAVEKSTLFRSNVAHLYALFGRNEQARVCYKPLLDRRLLDDARDDDWLMMLALTAEAAALCGDRSAARELYPRLLPHAACNVVHVEWLMYFGSCAYFLGLLAALLGERKAAAEHFEAALEMNARLGARPYLARTSLAYAQLLHGAGRAGEGAAVTAAHARSARALAREAAAIAEEIGMQGLLREARALAQ